ncbi:MAG: hypothetical protein ACE5I3_05855 [Phycisphaerae bacterium]
MNTPERSTREQPWRMFYLCTCVTLSAIVFGIFVSRPGINGYDRAMFADMVYGTAHKPFVYRALLPTAVRLVASGMPSEAKARFTQALADTAAIDNLFKILGWEREYLVEYFIAIVPLYLCLWGFVWSLRYLLRGVYHVSAKVQDVLTLVALVGLTQFFRYYSYLYDLPNVFLFTLALALMVRSKWKSFLLVYLIACLNKETTILLTMIFAIHFLKQASMSRAVFGALLPIQLAIFGLVRLVLFVAFRDNPGSFVELHVPHHNLDLLGAYPLATVFGWCGLALLLFYRWSAKPAFLRHSLWIVVPLVVLTFFFGYLDELRDYYEAYPIVLLLLLHSVSRIWGFEVTSADRMPVPASC